MMIKIVYEHVSVTMIIRYITAPVILGVKKDVLAQFTTVRPNPLPVFQQQLQQQPLLLRLK